MKRVKMRYESELRPKNNLSVLFGVPDILRPKDFALSLYAVLRQKT